MALTFPTDTEGSSIPMASIERYVRRDGATSFRVKWREGGREGFPQTFTFDTLDLAENFKTLVELPPRNVLPDRAQLAAHGFGWLLPAEPAMAVPETDITLVQFAYDYCDRLIKPNPQTVNDYRSYVRLHLEPFFKQMRLVDVTRADLRRWQQIFMLGPKLDADKRPTGNQELSAKMIRNVRGGVLSPMFKKAMLRGERGEPAILDYNPLDGLEAPERVPFRRQILESPEEAQIFISAAYETDPEAADLIVTQLACAMRWGEVAGLPPAAVFPDRGLLEIWQVAVRDKQGPPERRWFLRPEPKTEAGYRRFPVTTAIGQLLGRRAATGRDLIFTNPAGGLWHYHKFHRHRWTPILALAQSRGLSKHLTTHGLRKSLATLLAEANTDPVTLAEAMGHKRAQTTLDLYTHATGKGYPAMREVVAGFLPQLGVRAS
jgi:integrase